MDSHLFQEFARLEDRHWWFVGRRAVVREVLRRHLEQRDARILDVGCGTGGMLRLLSEFGRVEGLEASSEALALCRSRLGSRFELHQGELPGGIPAGRTYELITAFDVLEHIAQVIPALASMRDALADRGTLVCTVPAYQFLWSAHDMVNHHHRRYTRALLAGQLRAAGFEITYSSYFNSALLAPVAAVRLAKRWLARSGELEQESDFEETPPLMNWALARIFSAERLIVPRLSLPFGVSLLAVAQRRRIPGIPPRR